MKVYVVLSSASAGGNTLARNMFRGAKAKEDDAIDMAERLLDLDCPEDLWRRDYGLSQRGPIWGCTAERCRSDGRAERVEIVVKEVRL